MSKKTFFKNVKLKLQMKEWFPIRSDKFQYMDWVNAPYKGFSGPIIRNSKVASVGGGFGNMLFQGKLRPLFGFWLNDYDIKDSFISRTSFNFRSIEFRLLLRGDIEHRSWPHKWSSLTAYGMNLSHSLAMDSEVKFVKDNHYRSVDIHFKPEIFERLAQMMPELVCPFLNDYYAGRELSLFKKDVRVNSAILSSVSSMLLHVTEDGLAPMLLDRRGEILLGQILLWKAELEQRRGLTANQIRVLRDLNVVKNLLTVEEETFNGIKRYAQLANMSETKFKTAFKQEIGAAPFEYWKLGQLQKGVLRLLTTGDTVKEIALDIGFSDAQAFNKAFRKMFEESPTSYRRRIAGFDIAAI